MRVCEGERHRNHVIQITAGSLNQGYVTGLQGNSWFWHGPVASSGVICVHRPGQAENRDKSLYDECVPHFPLLINSAMCQDLLVSIPAHTRTIITPSF